MISFNSYIKEETLTEGVYDPGILKAFFTAGGPGSGKSYVTGQAGLGKFSPMGIKIVNSDVHYEKLLKDAAIGGSYDSLRGFHYNSLFIGSMWFQDAFNLNVDRLQRCVIHYTTLEGIVPFCSYNGIGIGDKIRDKHSIPIKEWEKQTGRTLKDDLRRDLPLT